MLALTGEGWWRMALSYQATEAMTLAWFKQQGLVPATGRYLALQTEGNRRGTYNVCSVVWEEGRREDPSCPIAWRPGRFGPSTTRLGDHHSSGGTNGALDLRAKFPFGSREVVIGLQP